MASLVAQLGANFTSLYHVDPNYKDTDLTCALADVQGKKCGDVLRWVCQASGTFPRADSETGFLTVEPFWNQGNKLDLDNMQTYPVMKANGDVGALIFTLNDGSETQYVVTGTSAASSETVSISNPFIKAQAQALTAARMILSTYGGNQLETTGRGDPSSEIGDVDTVWLNESRATTGRRMMQTFAFSNGVLQGCQSVLLQADGAFLFEEMAVITQSGTWTAPAGVTRLRVVIGQGGQGGGHGADGTMGTLASDYSIGNDGLNGNNGSSGQGGKIWFGTIDINPEQSFQVAIGQGGAPAAQAGIPGDMGGETTFGPYSSANGEVYPLGYTDIASGDSYGRTGVASPVDGTSDGGQGGEGGMAGYREYSGRTPVYNNQGEEIGFHVNYSTVVKPTPGKPGKAGASGFVLVYWDKDEVSA